MFPLLVFYIHIQDMVHFVILGHFYTPTEHFEEINQQALKVRMSVYVEEGRGLYIHTFTYKA